MVENSAWFDQEMRKQLITFYDMGMSLPVGCKISFHQITGRNIYTVYVHHMNTFFIDHLQGR